MFCSTRAQGATVVDAPDKRVWAGVLASVVFLVGASLMSFAEQDFMDRDLGWDVWPSGLALGPHGWGQVVVFVLFVAAYLTFATALLDRSWSRPGRWGARVFAVGAVLALGLPFRTDRPRSDITWHGGLHAAGYGGMMLTLLVSLVLIYPGLVRSSTPAQWGLAPLALLLVPLAWVLPDSKATSNYLFFAIPFSLLAALALRLARDPSPIDI
jgi:hypothetical protein